MFTIGQHTIDSPVLLAPMAGVTDLPFRRISRHFGAGLTTSEMLTSDTRLWHSRKSRSRLTLDAQDYPISMQIAGSDPLQMAQAATACVELGADIVDINMGCPAKKVCKKLAGSALLSDEALVQRILHEVVNAVDVPVTLKTRTGISPEQRNGVEIARIAEDAGIQALAMHGRTRACKFHGHVHYDTIAQVVDAVSIPVFVNGDITCVPTAIEALQVTGATAVMIGRGALGQPWLLQDIKYAIQASNNVNENGSKQTITDVTLQEKQQTAVQHIQAIHTFYGDVQGVRIARKHFAWYCDKLSGTSKGRDTKKIFNTFNNCTEQIDFINDYFSKLLPYEEQAA